ncbi:MAG: hypothetical protein WAJ92_13140 [Candidatus Acidiferrales bacterium]
MQFIARIGKQLSFLAIFAALAALAAAAPDLRANQSGQGATQFDSQLYQELRWRCIGPFRGGRTRAVSGVASQPNVFYMGQVNGGVWKSDDYGRTWNPIFDAQPSQSIGAIAVAPSDPNIIYVASGEGLQRPDLSVGDGIYKSTDAGKTWTHLGLRDGEQIPALAVDPRDPNRVFAAVLGHPYGPNAERGVFRSTDGGATWQKVLYKDENTGASDIEMDPANPDTLYAGLWQVRQGPWEDNNEYNGTGGGLFKSTDGGTTWRPLTAGLPKNLVQIYVAIAPSQPARLYATVATSDKGDYGSGNGLGVYRSDDAGEHWQQATADPRPAMRIGGGDLPVPRVDPKNPDVVYSTSIVTLRSIDGGKTWTSLRGAPGGDDYQNIWINPSDPNIILLVSDQGAIVSVNRGETWSSWYNQPTAQLYHASTSNTFPYRVCGGQQESGSVCISSRGNDGEITFRDWHPVGAIEYGYVTPDPLDANIIYGAGRNAVTRYHWDTGQVENITPIPARDKKYRTDRTQPILFSPVDPHVLYFAANVLFKSTTGGRDWEAISPDLTREKPGIPASLGNEAAQDPSAEKERGVIYSLAPSHKTIDTLWAGTDDGLIWITRDGGKNWKNITPPDLTPWSKVTQIEASHFDDNTAYASISRFRVDDRAPYIYRTHDGGATWQKIVGGLPNDAPVDTVREDPVRKGLLFAGTETSVWVSFDDGGRWQSLQLNLPHTSMRDLAIHDDDLIVATHGRSFWILDDIAPLREITGGVANSPIFLFQPALAYRARRSTNTDTPLPPDEPAGQNPPDGAIFDYWLKSGVAGPVTLEILDANGKVLRRFASTDKPEVTQEDLEKQLIPLYWIRPQQILSSGAGMHRFVWDLRLPPPGTTQHEYPISAVPHDTPRYPVGPAILPGKYEVRLTVAGLSGAQQSDSRTTADVIRSASFEIKMDPRVPARPSDLAAQFKLASGISEGMTASFNELGQARSVQSQLQALVAKIAKGPLADVVHDLQEKIGAFVAAEPGEHHDGADENFAQLNGELGGLLGMVDSADAAPTAALQEAADRAQKSLGASLRDWDIVKRSEIPAINQRLREAQLPALDARREIAPADEEMGADEP